MKITVIQILSFILGVIFLLFDNSKQLKKYIRKISRDELFKQKMVDKGLEFIKDKTIANSVNGLFKQYKKLV